MFYKLTQTVENYNPYDQMRVGDYNGKPTSARPQSAALSRPSSSPLVGSASGISNIVVPEDPLNSLREEYVPPSQRDQQQRPASKKPSTEPIPEEKAETSARPSFFSGLLGFSKKEPEPTGFEDANIQTNASSNVPPISNRPLSAVTNTTTPYGAVSSSQQSTAREPRSMPNTPMAVSSAPGSRPPSGNKFEALIQEQASFKKDDVYGDILRFKISAISVIDLKPAHQFSKNSPYINIACGRFVSMTEV